MSIREREAGIYKKLRAEWSAGDNSTELVSVSNLLRRAREKYGNRIALIDGTRELTYTELFHEVVRFAQFLKREGVRAGDKVLLCSHNSAYFYIAYLAVWQLGGVNVPLNTYLHESEIGPILAEVQPRLVLTSPTLERVITAAHNAEQLTSFVYTIDPDTGKLPSGEQVLWALDSVGQSQEAGHGGERLASEQTAVILYTSGTSGKPKGVMLSSKNILTNALQAQTRFASSVAIDSHERFLSVLPLFHVFAQNACMWLPLMLGASIIVVRRIDRRLIRQGIALKPTMFFGFPALFGLLVMMRDLNFDQVKVFISGADALSDKIRAAFALVYGRKICNGYGLTEASPIIAVDISNPDRETSNVGVPVVGLEVSIRDDNGNQCAPGEIGQLWVRGDNTMQGYFNAPDLTSKVLRDGWLSTGDLVAVRPDGTLAMSGRKKDLIINKGFNIYPQEVENILLRHPAIIKAAVVGKSEESTGEVPIAFVALRDGYDVNSAELVQFCRRNLAPYKVPRSITCLDDLPMTPTGKIDKKQLGEV